MERRPAPQGQQNSAQGFNPGKPSNKQCALKGRKVRVPDEAHTYGPARVRAQDWDLLQLDIGPLVRLVRTFDPAPLQGASLLVDDPRVETLG